MEMNLSQVLSLEIRYEILLAMEFQMKTLGSKNYHLHLVEIYLFDLEYTS